MTAGVLIFEGMTVGILPGDFTLSISDEGVPQGNLILSTSYNVTPIWLRIASDNLKLAKLASINIEKTWPDDSEQQRSLLISELTPSMQVIISCGIALDSFYDMLRPHAKLTQTDIDNWKINKTGRAKQITEVIRRVYRLKGDNLNNFKRAISEIINLRDLGVHPSLELKQACNRPDLPVSVDWKFAAYRYSNARSALESTLKMLIHLFETGCANQQVIDQMKNIFSALVELGVVSRANPSITIDKSQNSNSGL